MPGQAVLLATGGYGVDNGSDVLGRLMGMLMIPHPPLCGGTLVLLDKGMGCYQSPWSHFIYIMTLKAKVDTGIIALAI